MNGQLVITHGNIITMSSESLRALALAFENGRIVGVGSNAEVQSFINRDWPVLDLGGKTVLPGFIDTHEHMMLTGLMVAAVHLDDVENIDQILEKIAEKAKRTEKNAWIRGSYLNEQNITEERMPTRKDLDRASPNHPVFLLHATCHMCSFNSRALEIINLPLNLEGVDMESGQPTGVVRDPGILTFVHPAMSKFIYGELTYSQETMDRFILEANRAGLQIAVHCESERSIEQVLWAMEKALRDFPRTDHRHRIEHLELPTFNQLERMAKAGIMTGMQPAFIPAFIGRENMEMYEALLGRERLRRVHPYRTILDHGIPICGGSDSPVTPYDPLAGIQAAVNHPSADERVTLYEAIEMFTATAAWSAFEEKEKGTIEAGKLADLVILRDDPFAVDAEKISDIKIEQVFVGGQPQMTKPDGPE